jgi:hypothetical protein
LINAFPDNSNVVNRVWAGAEYPTSTIAATAVTHIKALVSFISFLVCLLLVS